MLELLDHVGECCGRGCAVDIGSAAFTASLNFLSNTIFSVNLAHGHDSDFSQEFKEVVCGMMEGIGRPNLADYFPTLRLIDPQGIRRKMNVYFDKLFDIFNGIISERLQYSKASSTSKDVLDALLNLTKENDFEWSCNDIKHLLLVGNTSSLTLLNFMHLLLVGNTSSLTLFVKFYKLPFK